MSTNISKYTIARMKDSRLRITPQRAAVLEYLLHTDSHPTADEIYRAIESRFPGISLTTVYNNLNSLCENGLAQELSFGRTSSRFDGDTTNHYHIICNNCGKMVDLHYPLLKELEAFAELTAGFKVSHHRLDIYGTCETCSEE